MSSGNSFKTSVNAWTVCFAALLVALFAFRLWFATTLPLSGDEAYHWEWSRHPALGYYDHPPLTAYLIGFFTRLFGRSAEWTVRLAALVSLTGTAIACFLFARDAVRRRGGGDESGARAGFFSGLLVGVTPVFAILFVYISTDPPLILFWALTLFLTWRAANHGGISCWIGAGLCLGLAILSKFLSFFLLPTIGLFFLLSPEDRTWLKRPHPYVAGMTAAAVIGPFVWWNATHGWATFVFNFVARQKDASFSPMYPVEFVAGQLGALSPGIIAFAVCGLWRSARDWLGKRDRLALLLGLNTLLPLAYFAYAGLQRRIGAHWPAGAWLGALVYLPVWLEEHRKSNPSSRLLRLAKWSLLVCIAQTLLMHALPHTPPEWSADWLSSPAIPQRDKLQTFSAERFGWVELGRRVEEARREMLAARKDGNPGVFVICNQYGMAASVAFYTPGRIETHLWAPRRVHGENYRFWDDFGGLKGQDALFVCKRDPEKSLPDLKERFATVGDAEEIPVSARGRIVRSFFVVRCFGFDGANPSFEPSR